MEEGEVVVAHHECAAPRVGDMFLKIDADQTRLDGEVEAMALAPVPAASASRRPRRRRLALRPTASSAPDSPRRQA